MDDFLTHTFNITFHPIGKLEPIYRKQYAEGLAEFLCYISHHSPKVRVLYEAWVSSILGSTQIPEWGCKSDNFTKTKLALDVKRDGLSFFSMRQSFIFDCFYLLSVADIRYIEKAYNIFYHHICGAFTRFFALSDIYAFFCNRQKEDNLLVPDELLQHRKLDIISRSTDVRKFLVVATMNAGKSTLINAIAGYPINRVQNAACTNKLRYIFNKPHHDGLVTYKEDGSYCYSPIVSLLDDNVSAAAFHFNADFSGNDRVCLIDTPGINAKKYLSHAEITLRAINDNKYDGLIFVSNCQYFATNDENSLLDFVIKHTQRPIIYVLNQLDRFKPEDDSIGEMLEEYKSLIIEKGGNPIIVPLSAYAALLLKTDESKLGDYDRISLQIFKRKFSTTYYDLENCYYVAPLEQSVLSKTGIRLLEGLISKI